MSVNMPLEPGKPLKTAPVSELSTQPIFELTFKHGHMKEDLLFQAESLDKAIELGNTYCRAARLRFITVTPYIQDLPAMIAKLNGGSE